MTLNAIDKRGRGTLVSLLLVASLTGFDLQASVVATDSSNLTEAAVEACTRKRCRFDIGSNTYTVRRDGVRAASGREIRLSKKGDEVVASTVSDSGNVLAMNIANVTRARRGFGSSMGPSLASPDDFDRSFRVELYNPKSGTLIKSFDLGAFSVKEMGLSRDGSFLFVSGHDLERTEISEMRVYNARNGRMEFSIEEQQPHKVTIAANGFQLASGAAYRIQDEAGEAGKQIYYSRDPFSIAEYEIDCRPMASNIEKGAAKIGVANFDDGVTQQGELFAAAISSTFGGEGFRMVERTNLQTVLEEIQLSMTGLTESDIALDVGRLGVATHMVFGGTSRAGNNVSISTRFVSVETGEQNTSCTMICRECSDQDLFEGVRKLGEHWVGVIN